MIDWLPLPLSEKLIRSGSALFRGKYTNTEVIAARIDFEGSRIDSYVSAARLYLSGGYLKNGR